MLQSTGNFTHSLEALNKEIQKKYPGLELVRGEGYYYLYSDDPELGLKIAGLFCSGIYVYDVSHISLERWLIEIENLFNHPNN